MSRILFIPLLVSVANLAACKASKQELESSTESVGFNTKALLFHKKGENLVPRNINKLPGSSKTDIYEFLICDKLKANLGKDMRKANINFKSCKNAFTGKNGDCTDLLLQVNITDVRGLQDKASFNARFHGLLDSFLGLASFTSVAVFSVAGGMAGGTVGVVTGGAAGGVVGSAVPVAGTAVGAVSGAASGGITGAAVGFAKGVVVGLVVTAAIGVIKGKTTNRWKQADETTLKYFKDIFNLDNGGQYQEVTRARDIRFILLWISDHFDAKLKPEFVRLGEGDPTDFD